MTTRRIEYPIKYVACSGCGEMGGTLLKRPSGGCVHAWHSNCKPRRTFRERIRRAIGVLRNQV